jgi:hypothetical protein
MGEWLGLNEWIELLYPTLGTLLYIVKLIENSVQNLL